MLTLGKSEVESAHTNSAVGVAQIAGDVDLLLLSRVARIGGDDVDLDFDPGAIQRGGEGVDLDFDPGVVGIGDE